jgi:hypothetical protein
MGQVRSLDHLLNKAGYLRLTTCKPYVRHMGNRLEAEALQTGKQTRKGRGNRLVDFPLVREPLLWLYDRIFKLYY